MEIANLVQAKYSQCFHILGLDVLFDDIGGLWLLEVNSAPSFDIDEAIPLPDMQQSAAKVNLAAAAAAKEVGERFCRCGALPHPHTHNQSPVDVAVKLPVVEGALVIASRARKRAISDPIAWAEGTIYV